MTQIRSNVIIPEGEPPSELLLLKFGRTETTEGPYFLSEEGAIKVLSTYKKRKLKLYFDYEHKSLDPQTPDQGKAAGWYTLEIRKDGIWATDIKWTEQAATYLKNREYAYFSPVLKTDNASNVVRLVNVALTNLPATDDLQPLMELKEENMEEQESPLQDLETDMKEIAAEVLDQVTDAVIEKITDTKVDGVEMKEHLSRIDSALAHAMGLSQHLHKHVIEMSEGDMRACFDKAHSSIMKMVDLLKEKRKELDPHGMYMEKPYMEEYRQLSEKVQEITGQAELDKQVGILFSLRDSKENIKVLNEQISLKDKEIKQLKDSIEQKEKESIVDNAINGPQKKLLLKQRNWALSLNKEQLSAYLEHAQVLSFSEKILDKPVEEPQATLSEKELNLLEVLNKQGVKVTAEQFLSRKKEKGLL